MKIRDSHQYPPALTFGDARPGDLTVVGGVHYLRVDTPSGPRVVDLRTACAMTFEADSPVDRIVEGDRLTLTID